MVPPPAHDQVFPAPARTRDRPSRLTDIALALLLVAADTIIVVTGTVLLLAVGLGTAQAPHSSPTARSRDVPFLVWLVVWGVPAVAAVESVVHARLRMPVTTVVQGLFTLACTLLAVAWTRMLLS
ncbi:hypothetical protein DKG34_40735 [Streptomyces sp. NWU49]|uniref:DUF6234 family protein n=1 Tax=Streptomyces sp. NWU49 TaxID=2201153 RepID=UPI000D67FC3A|nr:DUF6234 family protein [Streptomyces sp. NWU49]PWJ02077.1 hypothetical protein DKG34_40735 [Streptomyces sp. NWU49]